MLQEWFFTNKFSEEGVWIWKSRRRKVFFKKIWERIFIYAKLNPLKDTRMGNLQPVGSLSPGGLFFTKFFLLTRQKLGTARFKGTNKHKGFSKCEIWSISILGRLIFLFRIGQFSDTERKWMRLFLTEKCTFTILTWKMGPGPSLSWVNPQLCACHICLPPKLFPWVYTCKDMILS